MKTLLLLSFLTLAGCASGQIREKTTGCMRPIFADTIFVSSSRKAAYRKCVQDYRDKIQAEEAAKEKAWRESVLASEKPGTSRLDFEAYHGPAEETEYVNGQAVHWYDDSDRPAFVVFKDDKLVTFLLDRETINARIAQKDAAERRAEMEVRQAEMERRMRFQQAAAAFSSAIQADQQRQQMNQMNNQLYYQQQRINNLESGGRATIQLPGN